MPDNNPAATPFEFSADNNKLFRSAGYWMGIVGRLGVLFGVLFAVLYGSASTFRGWSSPRSASSAASGTSGRRPPSARSTSPRATTSSSPAPPK